MPVFFISVHSLLFAVHAFTHSFISQVLQDETDQSWRIFLVFLNSIASHWFVAGFGILNLRVMNVTLHVKWIYYFLNERNCIQSSVTLIPARLSHFASLLAFPQSFMQLPSLENYCSCLALLSRMVLIRENSFQLFFFELDPCLDPFCIDCIKIATHFFSHCCIF